MNEGSFAVPEVMDNQLTHCNAIHNRFIRETIILVQHCTPSSSCSANSRVKLLIVYKFVEFVSDDVEKGYHLVK